MCQRPGLARKCSARAHCPGPCGARTGTTAACSKNYRRSVNFQVTIHARDRRVIAVGDDWPGNRNDIVVYRATMADQLAGHRLIIGDGAYRTAPDVITSKTKSKAFAKRRARVEHAIARLKDFQVLRQHRRRGKHFNDTARAVAVLHNLKIDCPELRNIS